MIETVEARRVVPARSSLTTGASGWPLPPPHALSGLRGSLAILGGGLVHWPPHPRGLHRWSSGGGLQCRLRSGELWDPEARRGARNHLRKCLAGGVRRCSAELSWADRAIRLNFSFSCPRISSALRLRLSQRDPVGQPVYQEDPL